MNYLAGESNYDDNCKNGAERLHIRKSADKQRKICSGTK